jgi:uncharacterized protein YlxW (UPF0749 family)
MSFLTTVQNQSFQQELSTLLSKIENYEKRLNNDISDYEIQFESGKEYYFHTYNKNYSPIQQFFSYS